MRDRAVHEEHTAVGQRGAGRQRCSVLQGVVPAVCLLDGRELDDDHPVVLGPVALACVRGPAADEVAAAVLGDRRRRQLPIAPDFLVVQVLRFRDHICGHGAIMARPLGVGNQRRMWGTTNVPCDCVSALHSGELEVTAVTYPSGSLRETATVVHMLPHSPCGRGHPTAVDHRRHPVPPADPLWPDSPPTTASCTSTPRPSPCATPSSPPGAGDGPLVVDDAINARRRHALPCRARGRRRGAAATDGTEVTLVVDEHRRRRLSAAHTACHLLAYALNEATHDLWRKPTSTDSRGHHDLDVATCVSTRHDVDGSLDHYRLGKSLRKRGFDSAQFLDELPATIDEVNRALAWWIESDAPVRIDTTGPALTDRRQWVCETPGGTAQMPCGGTHVRSVGEIASILEIRNQVRVSE